ncbi:unnamed protein product, partial [Meganyctiphanes norvegica]
MISENEVTNQPSLSRLDGGAITPTSATPPHCSTTTIGHNIDSPTPCPVIERHPDPYGHLPMPENLPERSPYGRLLIPQKVPECLVTSQGQANMIMGSSRLTPILESPKDIPSGDEESCQGYWVWCLNTSLKPVYRQVLSSVCVALVGAALGAVMAFPGPALAQWEEDPHVRRFLTKQQKGWFVSVAQLTAIPGSLLGGALQEQLGPRRVLLLLLPFLMVSWLLLLLAYNDPLCLILTRAIQGFIVASCSVAVYIYPCEITEGYRRGVVGALPDAAFSLGFLITYLLVGLMSWQNLVIILLPTVFLPCYIATAAVPESPVWLMHHNRTKEARLVEQWLRPNQQFTGAKESLITLKCTHKERRKPRCHSLMLLSEMRYLLPVIFAVILLILKESSGQFVVVLFVMHIFKVADVSLSPHWSSVLVGCARMVANLVCCLLLTLCKRRPLLATASMIASCAMSILGLYFYTHDTVDWPGWVPLACLMTFMLAYGGGIGPVSFLLATEILPGSVRGVGSGLAQAAFSSVQFTFSRTFGEAQEALGIYTCLWLYATGCLALALFTLLLPETRQLTLEQVEEYWEKLATKLNFCSTKPSRRMSVNSNSSSSTDSTNSSIVPSTASTPEISPGHEWYVGNTSAENNTGYVTQEETEK